MFVSELWNNRGIKKEENVMKKFFCIGTQKRLLSKEIYIKEEAS